MIDARRFKSERWSLHHGLPPENISGDKLTQLSAEQIEEITRAKIDHIIEQLTPQTRFLLDASERRLFSAYASQEVYITSPLEDAFSLGVTTADDAQNVIVDLLVRDYGLNERQFRSSTRLKGFESKNTKVESLLFPSLTHQGLGFTRVVISDREGLGIDSLHWYANDIGPAWKFRGKVLIPGKS